MILRWSEINNSCCRVLGAWAQSETQAQKRPNGLFADFCALVLASCACVYPIRQDHFSSASAMATGMQKTKDMEDEGLFFSTISNPSWLLPFPHSCLVTGKIGECKNRWFRWNERRARLRVLQQEFLKKENSDFLRWNLISSCRIPHKQKEEDFEGASSNEKPLSSKIPPKILLQNHQETSL